MHPKSRRCLVIKDQPEKDETAGKFEELLVRQDVVCKRPFSIKT